MVRGVDETLEVSQGVTLEIRNESEGTGRRGIQKKKMDGWTEASTS